MRCVVLAAALVLLSRSASADRTRPKVAVVPGIVVNLAAARVDALTQTLAEALQAELEVEAIGGVEVRRRLPPAGLPTDCVASAPCIADVAQRLGAEQLLFVVLIDTGSSGAIQIDSTWVDPVAHRSGSRPAIDIAMIADARSRFAAVASQLLPDAAVRPRPQASLGRMSEPVPRHFTLPAYLTSGATLVGLSVGVSLGIDARNRYNECTALAHAGTACSQSRKDAIRRVDLVADAGWLVAIGGTIATAILYATSSEASHVIVEPVPGGAAVTASGRF
ncbi:MAG TPA: hypothetical protein VHT91_11040 [Kofleriaceae bacterium]|jgi:hypothetical protein|nr:hypothetical protein [Kofleriaceae bacterium]